MDTNSLTNIVQSAVNAAQLNSVMTAMFGFLGVVALTLGKLILAKIEANSHATKAMVEVGAAQSFLNGQRLEKMEDIVRRTYTVVNKPFGKALEAAAKTMEHVAQLPGATQEQLLAANTARTVSDEHRLAMDEYEQNERVHAALTAAIPAKKAIV